MQTITRTVEIALTVEEAKAELARRAHNRKAKKDESLTRREPASDAAFSASKSDLEAVIAAAPASNRLGFLTSCSLHEDTLTAAESAGIAKVDRSGEFPYVEVFADTKYLTCTHECGGCVNGELCDAVLLRALNGDDSILAYGIKSVAHCGHDGECAALAGR